MKRVDLPFNPIFICEICGASFRDWESAKRCEEIPIQKSEVKINDKVIFRGEEYTVYELRYSCPNEYVRGNHGLEWVGRHILFLSIRQYRFFNEGGSEVVRAWESGDSSCWELRIPYREFLEGFTGVID